MPRHPPNALTSLTTRNSAPLAWRTGTVPSRSAMSTFLYRFDPRRSDIAHPLRLTLVGVAGAPPGTEGSQAGVTVANVQDSSVSHIVSATSLWNYPSGRGCACSCFVQLFNCQRRPAFQSAGVGQERLELSTPRLSSACSNQLSYWPGWPLIGPSRPNSE